VSNHTQHLLTMDADWAWWEANDERTQLQEVHSMLDWRQELAPRRRRPPSLTSLCCHHEGNDEYDDSGALYELGLAKPYRHYHYQDCVPRIDLSFDTDKMVTVASLSDADNRVFQYFKDQVKLDQVRRLDDLTYELHGFVRENFTRLKLLKCLDSVVVRVCQQSLDASDAAYKKVHAPSITQSKHAAKSFDRLEEVMEIVRLHWLDNDLDLVSVYCMMKSCKVFQRVGGRIARRRLASARLSIHPHVDGCGLSGISQFIRPHPNNALPQTTIYYEFGRPVEYVTCEPVAVEYESKTSASLRALFATTDNSSASFQWNCEELVMANLVEGIPVREYAGQKLCLCWDPDKVDQVASSHPATTLKLGETHIETVPSHQTLVRHMACCNMTLHINKNEAVQTDEVTVKYSGSAEIVTAEVQFQALVRALAMQMELVIRQEQNKIQETRPLWDCEISYLAEVRAAARL